MWDAFLSSFTLVALSEFGDKTQLLSISLAARFRRPGPVLAGILAATLLNHALAASAGSWISRQVPPFWMGIAVGVAFLAFGLWTLVPDRLDEPAPDAKRGVFLTTLILFFVAEMGDKTQLATIALAARYPETSFLTVTVGTTLGMMLTNGLAVLLGDRMGRRLRMDWIRRVAAALFILFGVATLVATATRP